MSSSDRDDASPPTPAREVDPSAEAPASTLRAWSAPTVEEIDYQQTEAGPGPGPSPGDFATYLS